MKGLLFFGAFALLAFVSCKDIDVPYVPEDTPEETHDEARPGYSGSSPATGILETPDVLNLIDQKVVSPLRRQVGGHIFVEVVSGGYIVIFCNLSIGTKICKGLWRGSGGLKGCGE